MGDIGPKIVIFNIIMSIKKREINDNIRAISKEENKDSAIHVCGKKNKYFEDEIRPTKDFDQNAIEIYKRAMKASGAFGNKSYNS